MPMDTQLDQIHGTPNRQPQLIVDRAPPEQTLDSRDEAIEALAELFKELFDRYESDSGRPD
jgi:hypothetical protein